MINPTSDLREARCRRAKAKPLIEAMQLARRGAGRLSRLGSSYAGSHVSLKNRKPEKVTG